MKPYRNISSKNLPLMLFVARMLAYIGSLLFIVGIVLFVSITFLRTGMFGATTGIAVLPFAFTALVVSTLLAAVVAFEDNYRIRTEHLVSNKER